SCRLLDKTLGISAWSCRLVRLGRGKQSEHEIGLEACFLARQCARRGEVLQGPSPTASLFSGSQATAAHRIAVSLSHFLLQVCRPTPCSFAASRVVHSCLPAHTKTT